MTSISLRNIQKTFGKDTQVIKDVNLEIAPGEFCVFLGPSGCGKSTLLRMVAGIEDVTAGDLAIGGVRMNEVPAAKRQVAMVFQSYALYPHMSVYENMAFGLRQAKVDKIADSIPEQEVQGDADADLLVVGWGGTYGHLRLAMDYMREHGKKVAFAHFQYINPLPKNTADVLRKYKKIVVAEQNLGQFAGYLRMKVPGLNISQFNQVKGQPFVTRELIDAFTKLLEE